jgi:hypothetical protein
VFSIWVSRGAGNSCAKSDKLGGQPTKATRFLSRSPAKCNLIYIRVQLRPSYRDAARASKSHCAARPFRVGAEMSGHLLDTSISHAADFPIRVMKTIFQTATGN